MHVHLGCDLGPDKLANPVLLQLRHGLVQQNEVAAITDGRQTVWDGPNGADVLHLHWPEALVEDWNPPTEAHVEAIGSSMRKWRRAETHVVATVHNDVPHQNASPAYDAFFRAVYRHVDTFIHMGEASIRRLYARYGDLAASARHVVIPHGDYRCFPDDVGRVASRRDLGYRPGDTVALSFGALRSPDEINLLTDGFLHWHGSAKRLLLSASRWPPLSRLSWRYYRTWGPVMLDRRIRVMTGFVPNDEVQRYLRAADILVIPRIRALNSGNVALGFTFGTVVVGPQHGVIGETLRQTGNPTFDPRDPASLGQALEHATSLTRRGKGAENEAHARVRWNWRVIGAQHVSAYRRA